MYWAGHAQTTLRHNVVVSSFEKEHSYFCQALVQIPDQGHGVEVGVAN